MRSEIKYILRLPGQQASYETTADSDVGIFHTTLAELLVKLARPGMTLIDLRQGGLCIENDESYKRILANKRISALYIQAHPVRCNLRQG